MGVDTGRDCRNVARLIGKSCVISLKLYQFILKNVSTNKVILISGVKTFVNEFAAYDELGKLIDNQLTFYNWTSDPWNRNWSYTGDLDITFYPDSNFNTTDVLYYGYIEVSCKRQ